MLAILNLGLFESMMPSAPVQNLANGGRRRVISFKPYEIFIFS